MIISKANEFYGKLERWKHMNEKPDVTMGEMTKTNGTSGRKVPKKNYMDDRRSGCGGNYFDHWNLQRSIFEQK